MIDAPFLTDQDGLRFNLLQIDTRTLERLAIDAWSQTIAHEFRRKDVSELDGIDWRIINAVMKKRPQFQLQTLHVLQDGTFVRSQNTKDMTFPRPGAPIARWRTLWSIDVASVRQEQHYMNSMWKSCKCGIDFHAFTPTTTFAQSS